MALNNYRYYVMGQICIDENYRGAGIFDRLYLKHRELMSEDYELCLTEISTSNGISMRAHKRIGFEVIHSYKDDTDEWNILVWDWN